MSVRNVKVLKAMLHRCQRIMEISKGNGWAEDETRTEAVVFNFAQLGELAKVLEDSFTSAHTEIPWHQIRGLRNRIVHDYESIRLRELQITAERDIPTLYEKLKTLLALEEEGTE